MRAGTPNEDTPESAMSTTRDRVLTTIRTAPRPPSVEEIAHQLDLHHNSVRNHATALREAGLITQGSRADGGRGRPTATYRITSRGAWTGPRNYRLLASLLLASRHETTGNPATDARCTGEEWGRQLAQRGPAAANARSQLVATLDELGFEPTDGAASENEIELRNCPFRELVDPADGVVCAIHAGMLDGLMEGTADVELTPFTSPHACSVRISQR